jgi:DNA-binding HxlR family transcriptional regulator
MSKNCELLPCPIETTVSLINNKWKILIIRNLLSGTKRFGELKKSLDSISQKVLTQQLRDMEKDALLHRKVYAEVPPKVEYSLSDTGMSLRVILEAMREWGEAYQSKMN